MAPRRKMVVLWTLLTIEVASVGVGPLIAHAAGASNDGVILAAAAGPVTIWLVCLITIVVYSCIKLLRDARQRRDSTQAP